MFYITNYSVLELSKNIKAELSKNINGPFEKNVLKFTFIKNELTLRVTR